MNRIDSHGKQGLELWGRNVVSHAVKTGDMNLEEPSIDWTLPLWLRPHKQIQEHKPDSRARLC